MRALTFSDREWCTIPRWLRVPMLASAFWTTWTAIGAVVPSEVMVLATWGFATWAVADRVRRWAWPGDGKAVVAVLCVGLAVPVLVVMAVLAVVVVWVIG